MDKMIIKELFILTNKLKRMLDKKYQEHNIRTGQARVLMYLYRTGDEVIYQKDIENYFQIRGGTVTGMIDTLEKNNFIMRIDSELDKRKKRIVLTHEGKRISKLSIETTQTLEKQIYGLLNKTERSALDSMISKVGLWIDEEEAN